MKISQAEHHLHQVVLAAKADAEGHEELARRLYGEAHLRLSLMSNEELEELAALTAFASDRPVEREYQSYARERDKLSATREEWLKDLVNCWESFPVPEQEAGA